MPGKREEDDSLRLEGYLGTSKKPAASESERKAQLAAARASRSITRTSIRVYGNETKWLGGIADTLCSFDGLRDITGQFCDGAIVCLTAGEQQRLRGLLHQAMEDMDIGLGLPQPEAEVLTIEQLKGRRFQEVFVAPEINPESTELGGGVAGVRCRPCWSAPGALGTSALSCSLQQHRHQPFLQPLDLLGGDPIEAALGPVVVEQLDHNPVGSHLSGGVDPVLPLHPCDCDFDGWPHFPC